MPVMEFNGANTDLDGELMLLLDDEPVTVLPRGTVNPMCSGQLNDAVS